MKKMFVFALTVLVACARPIPVEAPVVVEIPPTPEPKPVVKPAKKEATGNCSSESVGQVMNEVCCEVACKDGSCSMQEYLRCGEVVIVKYFEKYSCKPGKVELDASCDGVFKDEQ